MKRTRRTFLMTTGGWLTGLAAGCGSGGSGGSGGSSTADLLTRIEPTKAEQGMGFVGDSLNTRFDAVSLLFPEVGKLVAAGTSATGEVLANFAGSPAFEDDSRLIALCTVLDRTQDRSAVRTLADFVERNLNGNLLYSLRTATYVLRRLTDQSVAGGLTFYEAVTIQESIAAARTWLAANPSVTQRHVSTQRAQARFGGCAYTRYLLRRDGIPNGYTFEVVRYADLEVPQAIAQSKTTDTVTGGGILISTFNGVPVDPLEGAASKYANCAGFVLNQLFGIRGCYDTVTLYERLLGTGMVERSRLGDAQENDFVVFYEANIKDPSHPGLPHVGVVARIHPLTIINKDNQGPVFLAPPDAYYYTQIEPTYLEDFHRPKWTPHYFYFPTSLGYIDAILDPNPALASNPAYLQDASGHVKGTIR